MIAPIEMLQIFTETRFWWI